MERELETMLLAGNSQHTDSFDTLDRLMQVSERTATMAKVNAGILQEQTKKVEDLIVSSIADTSLEARARMIVRRMVGRVASFDQGVSKILASLSDPEVMDMLCKQAIGMAKMSDQELAATLGEAERIDSISANKFLAAKSVDEQQRMVEDLFLAGVDPAMQERVRYVVRTMVCKDFDARKLLGDLYDPIVFAQLRAKVMIMAEMPAEMRAARKEEAKTKQRLEKFENPASCPFYVNKILRIALDEAMGRPVQFHFKTVEDVVASLGLSEIEKKKVAAKSQAIAEAHFVEDAEKHGWAVVMALAGHDKIPEAMAFRVKESFVRYIEKWMLDGVCQHGWDHIHILKRSELISEVSPFDMKLIVQSVKNKFEDVQSQQDAVLLQSLKMAKIKRATSALLRDDEAKAAAEAKAKRVADALLRDEAQAKAAKAKRVADALLRDEAKAKEAAERRVDKAERIRVAKERAAEAREDAKAVRAAEARRAADEKEARRAIELVEARCATEARRAAARAAKKEKKQARLAEVCDIYLIFTGLL